MFEYQVKFEGTKEIQRSLTKAFKQFPSARDLFLRRQAELLKGRVKLLTPADTGYLRRSWQRTEPLGESIEVYDNVEYAAHVEYGHRIVYKKRSGEKIDTGRRVEGIFMLRDSLDECRVQFNADAKKFLQRLFQ